MRRETLFIMHVHLITQRFHGLCEQTKEKLCEILDNRDNFTDQQIQDLRKLIHFARERMMYYNEKIKGQAISPDDLLKYIDLFWVGDSLMHILNEENPEFKNLFIELRNLLIKEVAKNPGAVFLLIKAHTSLIPPLVRLSPPKLIRMYFLDVCKTFQNLVDLTLADGEPHEEIQKILTWMNWTKRDLEMAVCEELYFYAEARIHISIDVSDDGQVRDDVKGLVFHQLNYVLQYDRLDFFLELWVFRAFDLINVYKKDFRFGQTHYMLQVIRDVLDDNRDLLDTYLLTWMRRKANSLYVQLVTTLLTCKGPFSRQFMTLEKYRHYDVDEIYCRPPQIKKDLQTLKKRVYKKLRKSQGALDDEELKKLRTDWNNGKNAYARRLSLFIKYKDFLHRKALAEAMAAAMQHE